MYAPTAFDRAQMKGRRSFFGGLSGDGEDSFEIVGRRIAGPWFERFVLFTHVRGIHDEPLSPFPKQLESRERAQCIVGFSNDGVVLGKNVLGVGHGR